MSEAIMINPTPWGEREIRGPVHLFRERIMMRLLRPKLETGVVVDAGCGSGSFSLDMCKAGYRVHAVELSSAFVELVNHKIARYGNESRLTVQQSSVTELPFEDESFDAGVSGEVLEHVTDDQGGDAKAVRELHRVLRPGAVCVASVPLNPTLWDASDEWAGHVKRYRREQLVGLFESNGFEVENVVTWGFPLGRLYHKFLFSPWINRAATTDKATVDVRLDTRAAGNRFLVETAAWLLRFDELFSKWPWGRGVIISARRR